MSKVYYYDYDYKTSKHAIKCREAKIDEKGTAHIRLIPKGILERPAGEWISEKMMSHDLKACIHETLKEEVRQEMQNNES